MREKVLRRDLCIRFISGKDNLADVFTKPLSAHSFLHQRRKLLFDSSLSSPNHSRGMLEMMEVLNLRTQRKVLI